MFESLNRSLGTLRKSLDAPVIQISDVAANLMSGSRALSKVSVADTLDLSQNIELSRNDHDHPSASRHSISGRCRHV